MSAEVKIIVSGPVGSCKSALLGEIEIMLKAIGVPVRYEDEDKARAEKNGTHADWTDALEMYKPSVVLVEDMPWLRKDGAALQVQQSFVERQAYDALALERDRYKRHAEEADQTLQFELANALSELANAQRQLIDKNAELAAIFQAQQGEEHQPDAYGMTFDAVWDAIDWDKWRAIPIRELVRHIHTLTAQQGEAKDARQAGSGAMCLGFISVKDGLPELIPVGNPPHEFVAISERVLVCGWADQEFYWSVADLRRGGRGVDDRATHWNTDNGAFWGRDHLITHWLPLDRPSAAAAGNQGRDRATFEDARNAAYPVPDSPHASVNMRAVADRTAFTRGWDAARRAAADAALAAKEVDHD
jgi:hypothetical protein